MHSIYLFFLSNKEPRSEATIFAPKRGERGGGGDVLTSRIGSSAIRWANWCGCGKKKNVTSDHENTFNCKCNRFSFYFQVKVGSTQPTFSRSLPVYLYRLCETLVLSLGFCWVGTKRCGHHSPALICSRRDRMWPDCPHRARCRFKDLDLLGKKVNIKVSGQTHKHTLSHTAALI